MSILDVEGSSDACKTAVRKELWRMHDRIVLLNNHVSLQEETNEQPKNIINR